MVRVGFGRDSHPFEREFNKPLILGGIQIEGTEGLQANSDGDVVLHALFNAISQACGGESLGYYADPLCKKGITDSKKYIEIALRMAHSQGYAIQNVGIMIEAKRPYLPHETIDLMKNSIAGLLGISFHDIGITLTSGEGLTSFGRGKGILVEAVVTLIRKI